MQKIIEIEQHLLFFIDFLRVPKYRVRPIFFSIFQNITCHLNATYVLAEVSNKKL